MSDENRNVATGEVSVDDILKEVASWDAPPGEDSPTPEVSSEVYAEEAAEEAAEEEPEESVAVPEEETSPEETEKPTTGVVVELPLPPRPPEDERDPDDDTPPPDNLIFFRPPPLPPSEEEEEEPPRQTHLKKRPKKRPSEPEPETVREVALLVAARMHRWVKARREQFDPKKRKKRAELKAQARAQAQAAAPKHASPRFLAAPLPPPPDVPVKELVSHYGHKLSLLKLRCIGLALLTLLLLLLALVEQTNLLPLPEALREPKLLVWISFAVFLPVLLLAAPILGEALRSLFLGEWGLHSFVPLAVLTLLVDVFTLQLMQLRPYSPPLFLPVSLLLFCQQLGLYFKYTNLRQTCRTAASAAAPDLMTAEPSQWNGKPVYRRRFGSMHGFGSQVQAEDGAQRRFRTMAPFLLLAALLLPSVPLLLRHNPQWIPWAISATFCAAATLSGTFCFSLPYRGLCRRLSSLGVALAGWSGITTAKAGTGLLVEDTDLFPPGAVELKGFRPFGNRTTEQVISVTASLLRSVGSSLDPLFYSILRTEGGALLTATQVELHSEGISAHVAGEPVLVGTYNFLARQGVDMPEGVRVKTGVFCAIDNSFAGQFILEYKLHKSAMGAMDVLLSSRITPVLIGLDFNLVPSILKQLFRFPWEKMAFPDISQRAKLRAAPIPRETQLMAALCLHGLPAVAVAAVGAQRLYTAVRACSVFAILGAFLGIIMTAALATAAATTSLNPIGMSLFLLSWLLPTALISGWVNQF